MVLACDFSLYIIENLSYMEYLLVVSENSLCVSSVCSIFLYVAHISHLTSQLIHTNWALVLLCDDIADMKTSQNISHHATDNSSVPGFLTRATTRPLLVTPRCPAKYVTRRTDAGCVDHGRPHTKPPPDTRGSATSPSETRQSRRGLAIACVWSTSRLAGLEARREKSTMPSARRWRTRRCANTLPGEEDLTPAIMLER